MQSELLDKAFADALDKTKPLLYIPIAIDNKKYPYPGCLLWIKNTFDNLGVKEYVMWDEKDIYNYKKEKVTNFSGIYIGGGNTPYLLKTIKDNGFIDFIKEAMKKSLPIYGGSAGAIIFAKTIIPSLVEDENFVALTDLSAINAINNYELWCHYGPKEEDSLQEFIKKYNLVNMVALPEETGLVIDGTNMTVLGKKNALLINGAVKKEIKSGEKI